MADNTRRPPSLDLVSFASPIPPAPLTPQMQVVNEKTPPLESGNRWQYPQWSPYLSSNTAHPSPPPPSPPPPSQFIRQSGPIPIRFISRSSPSQLFRVLKPWLPLILYAITSLGFVVAVAFYRKELFACMLLPFFFDSLISWKFDVDIYRPRRTFFMVTIRRAVWLRSSFFSNLYHYHSYVFVLFFFSVRLSY